MKHLHDFEPFELPNNQEQSLGKTYMEGSYALIPLVGSELTLRGGGELESKNLTHTRSFDREPC